MGGDYWFTYIYESQTAERIRAAEQERLAAEIRSVIGNSSSRHAVDGIR